MVGTVRSLNSLDIPKMKEAYESNSKNLTFVEANLSEEKNWDQIVGQCDFVCHIASPVFFGKPKNANQFVEEAVNGVRYVLEACVRHKIKKVVITSSIAAIDRNDFAPGSVLTDQDWNSENTPFMYPRSKVLAEKMAWKVAKEGDLNLTSINPGLVIGPLLFNKYTPSQEVIQMMMARTFWVDGQCASVGVEDVARAHVKALEYPDLSKGKRYILVEKTYSFRALREILKKEYEPKGYKFGIFVLKKWIFSLGSIFSSIAKQALFSFFAVREYDGGAYVLDFGKPYDLPEKYVIDQADSLIKLGFVSQQADF